MSAPTAPLARPGWFRRSRAADGGPIPDSTQAPQRALVIGSGMAILALGAVIVAGQGAQQAALYTIGLALGLALYHARFGFTSAWRQLAAVGQGAGLRAHALMLGAACILFAPVLAGGAGLFGVEPTGNVSPLGLSLLVGAVLFGIGMQLGGACASGTLFAIGGGHSAIVVTLASFIAGSVLGAWHWDFWVNGLPALPAVSLAESRLGYPGALAVSLTVLAGIAWATVVVGRRRNPPPVDRPAAAPGLWRIARGSWPLWVGALVLAGLNALTLLTKGEPWGITSAFALWGSKIADAVGIDVRSWAYWSGDRAASLDAPLLSDATTVMNVGIVFGALLAAAAAGTFMLHKRIPARTAAAAVVGGLLMGYGARLAYGCNIGAYFSGIASFSLHGWAWGALALVGTVGGLRLRPLFGLANPKPTDSVC